MRRTAGTLLVLAAAGLPSELDDRLAALDREAASKLALLAAKAERANQAATARRLHERAFALDPDQSISRQRLGFRRGIDGWTLSKEGARAGGARRDEARDAADLERLWRQFLLGIE